MRASVRGSRLIDAVKSLQLQSCTRGYWRASPLRVIRVRLLQLLHERLAALRCIHHATDTLFGTDSEHFLETAVVVERLLSQTRPEEVRILDRISCPRRRLACGVAGVGTNAEKSDAWWKRPNVSLSLDLLPASDLSRPSLLIRSTKKLHCVCAS